RLREPWRAHTPGARDAATGTGPGRARQQRRRRTRGRARRQRDRHLPARAATAKERLVCRLADLGGAGLGGTAGNTRRRAWGRRARRRAPGGGSVRKTVRDASRTAAARTSAAILALAA